MPVVNAAQKRQDDVLVEQQTLAIQLSHTVQELYKSMDDSLRFKVTPKAVPEQDHSDKVISKDYRGVGCPMNFVKAKLVLETLSEGALLEVLLDDGEPINNVPNSLKLEGHQVLDQTRHKEGHWIVRVKKGS